MMGIGRPRRAQGTRWFVRGPSVPERWWPNKELNADSAAFAVQFGAREEDLGGRKIRAGAWFNDREAESFHCPGGDNPIG
jgi:hypothetical protein